MDPDKVTACVEKYLKEEFAKLGSKNKLNIESLHGAKAWVSSPNHWNFGLFNIYLLEEKHECK